MCHGRLPDVVGELANSSTQDEASSTGKREQAQEHLTTATTMYREMGMTYWLEKVQAEMRGPG